MNAGARSSIMGRTARTALDWFDQKLEFSLNILLYAYILIIIFVEVIFRYVLKASVAWAEETAVYAFIWLSYLSMSRLARTRGHLAFTLVRDAMPRLGQLVCLLIADVCLIVLSTVVILYMWQPLYDSVDFNQTMRGTDLPIWLATAAVPIGWIFLLVRTVQRAIDAVQKFGRGQMLVAEPLDLE